MSWFNHIASLSNPFELLEYFVSHLFSDQIQIICIDIILILVLHSFYILLLISLFKKLLSLRPFNERFRNGFLIYLLITLLVMLAHLNDIFVLTLVLDSFKVFPDSLTTFFYVSGMYTTIGSSSVPEPQWQILSMLISFCGLFAFSISGAGLYSMLGYFFENGESKQK